MIPGICIVTPTYPADLRRCELLVASLDRCAPDFEHVLIVDHRDRPVFQHLESPHRRILDSEAILSADFFRIPTRHGYWFNRRALPVRGWIMQQILKIGSANLLEAETLVYCDSDVAFARPFGPDIVSVAGMTRLFESDFSGPPADAWTQVACRLLGLDSASVMPRGYVDNMICWRRGNVLALQAHLEAATGVSWQQAIARRKTFSEYTLYGVFVRHVLGMDNAGHAPTDRSPIKHSWGISLASAHDVSDFFKKLSPESVGVMAHSKSPIDFDRLTAELRALWAESGQATTSSA
jgi:Family of unknown function (DUF6492)